VSCTKYTLTNPNNFPIVFSYQECSSLVWMYNQVLLKNQTKKIWFRDGTFSSASVNLPLPTSIPFPVTPSLAPIQVKVSSCCTGQQIEILTYPNAQIGFTYVIDGLCYTLIQLNTTGRVSPEIYGATFDTCSSCISSNPCPTPTPTPTISLTPTRTPTTTPTGTPTPTSSLTPSPTKTPTQTPTLTRTPNPTQTSTPTPTKTSTPPSSSTPTPTPTKTQTQTPTVTRTPNPTPTPSVTPTQSVSNSTPTPTPTSTLICEKISNGNFDQFASCGSGGGVCVGFFCAAPPSSSSVQYPQQCIPYWSTTSPNGLIEIWPNGYDGVPSYQGSTFAEVQCSLSFQALYQNITVGIGEQYQIQFAHRGRQFFPNTMQVGLSGSTGVVFFPTVYTGSTSSWNLNLINFTSTENEYNLVFSGLTETDGGNFIDAVSVVCSQQIVTQSPTPTSTPTTTPTVTPTLNLCTSFVSPPQTVNGITITESFSGSVTPYTFTPATCCNNTFTAPSGGVWLGNGGGGCPGPFFPFEYTLNFTTAVNEVDLVIYGGGCTGTQEETFTFTTDSGIPVLSTQGVSCHSSISGNTIYQGLGGWTTNDDAPFIKFKITAPSSFTTLTVTGPGGRLGSILGLCSDSIPVAPTPTPTPTQEFCADVRNGNFDECNPISSINGLNCNCFTGVTSNVTNYTSGCIPFWFKGDLNDHVTIWSNTPPYYSGTTYLELNAFVTPTATPNPTPTPSPTNGVTPTPTVTPSSTSALLTLGVYVSVDSSLPPFSGTVWYSVRNGAYISTQPFPTGLTWTQLGSVVSIPQCNSSVYVGDISMNVNDTAYIQVRNENGTCLYKNEAGPLPLFEPCTYSGTLVDLYTNSFTYTSPGNTDIGIKVVSPLQKTASPFGFPWIYQDINVTNIASPYSIQFAHLGRTGYSNTMRVGVSGNTTGMQFFTGEFTGSTTGWTVHTETGYVFNPNDTQRKLVFSSTTCDDGGNFIDGVVMDCQNFAVTPTPTSSLTPTPTVTPTVSPSCAQSVFIFIPNL